MFSKIAKFIESFKVYIVLFWLVLAAAMVVLAPSLSEVGVTDDSQFLPRNTESAQAQTLLQEKFSRSVNEPAGSALIIIYNPLGLSQEDTQAARTLRDWLGSSNAPSIITGVTSVFDNAALSSTLISQDQTSMLISVDLSRASSSAPAREAVQSMRNYIQEQHPTAQIYLTGPAGTSRDVLTSIQQTIDKATLVTLILVIVLLLLIYRSPVAMLVPLITIGISYLVARGFAGYIAASGVNVSSLVDAYLVVTLFGIGTDYCLFMVSRFKEEVMCTNPKTATALALKHIGPVILASATTVIVALLCLGISRFGMNRTSGYILAIGVAVTLLAGLTLTPALISLFGHKLLWPGKLKRVQTGASGFWTRLGRQITRRPVWFVVPIIVLLALPYVSLPKITYSANMLRQMPPTMDSVEGYDLLEAHFSTGQLNPLNVVIESQAGLTSPNSLSALAGIAESLKTVDGVSGVQYFSAPANQLLQLGQQSRDTGNALNLTDVSQLSSQLSFFQSLGQNLQTLAVQYPGVTRSPNFQQTAANLTRISTAAGQIQSGAPQNIPGLLSQIKQSAANINDELQALSAEFNLLSSTPFTDWLRNTYFSEDGTLTRMDVSLSHDPYSNQSISAVSLVRETLDRNLQASALSGASAYVGGVSASQYDILAVNNTDFTRVLALAVIGILLVTILLLRSVIAPLYMIATVLLNFGATLGIATWLFLDVLKQSSMIYMLPIFVFVILIAVGSDYNIFLVSRIREEAHNKPLKDAICNSVANTGGVITSCGIILTGTFATLTTASLQMVFQVGAAIGIGVLIDTFLVRAILIPCLTTLMGRWNWWPSRLYRQ